MVDGLADWFSRTSQSGDVGGTSNLTFVFRCSHQLASDVLDANIFPESDELVVGTGLATDVAMSEEKIPPKEVASNSQNSSLRPLSMFDGCEPPPVHAEAVLWVGFAYVTFNWGPNSDVLDITVCPELKRDAIAGKVTDALDVAKDEFTFAL